MNIKQNYKKIIGISLIINIIVISLSAVFVLSQSSNTFTISEGVYPAHTSFTVYQEGSTFYAKNIYGRVLYTNTNETILIQNVNDVLTLGGSIFLNNVKLPNGVTLSQNVFVIEFYYGKVTYYNREVYNELTNEGILERYFTDNANLQTEIMYPTAIYLNNRTYISYQGQPHRDAWITYYDHENETWQEPIFVGTNPLIDVDIDDGHGTPAMIIDDNGYIHLIYGSHMDKVGYFKHTKSDNPEDISTWTDQADIIADGTYPNLVKTSNGDIYLFYRYYINDDNLPFAYRKSIDDCVNWGAQTKIIDYGSFSIYIGNIEYEDASPDKIHMIWTSRDRKQSYDIRHNISYAYFRPDTNKMYAVDGTDLGATVDFTEGNSDALVYDTYPDLVTIPRVHVTSGGVPYVMCGDDGTNEFYFFKTTSWTKYTVLSAKMGQWVGHDFIINNASNIELYLEVNTTYTTYNREGTMSAYYYSYTSGGDIWKIISLNSGVDWFVEEVVYAERYAGANPRVVLNYQSELKIIFAQSNQWIDYAGDRMYVYYLNLKLFAYGDNGYVYRRIKH